MAIYVNPDSPKRNLAPVKTFYVDDSSLKISRVRHILIGAITFWDESLAISDMLQLKQKFGWRVDEEIKWNSQKFTQAERNLFKEGMLAILAHCRGFLIVTDRTKQTAAVELANQLSDFCKTSGLSGFVCRFDKNIIQNRAEFDRSAFALDPPCAGWSEVDSAHDQLVQSADIFVGFQKLRMDFGLGRIDPNKAVEVEPYEGLRSQYSLGWFLHLALRHSLWGRADQMDKSGRVLKNNVGYGVRMSSGLPKPLQEQALSHLGRENLGCVH